MVRIGALPPPCMHPEHSPPMHLYLEPGSVYEHTCGACGESTSFNVPYITYSQKGFYVMPYDIGTFVNVLC
jgi:hypothetical protein